MNKRPHGIMYHHFHDKKKHIVGQGSISSESFNDMLDFYGKTHNIISAEEFMYKSKIDKLSDDDVCLTFDDGLLCQYDIAYPVMKDRGLTAFWFIYTSPLDGVMEKVEIYRHFRSSMFSDIEEFYKGFFASVVETDKVCAYELEMYNPDEHFKEFPFYTPNDKRFRFLRDEVLGAERYNKMMDKMLIDYKYDIENNSKKLWINETCIRDLHENGHVIGIHSYSHPTVMIKNNYEKQMYEYRKNKSQLENVIGECVISSSYPCNSYDAITLQIMRELGIGIGFRANMADVCLEDKKLEYPREDHANILKKMREEKYENNNFYK